MRTQTIADTTTTEPEAVTEGEGTTPALSVVPDAKASRPTVRVGADPATLLLDHNVRLTTTADKTLTESVRDHGVLVPIVAVRTPDGALRVRYGHRRTLAALAVGLPTVPVDDVADEDDDQVDRVLRQWAENEHRQPLQTQAEAAQVRTAKLDALHEDLAAQVQTLTTSEGWTVMLRAAAAFRAYSMRNVLLLALQMDRRGMEPGSRVAGFTTWKTLGRSVKSGEKGLAILAPCTYRKTTDASTGKETSPDATAAEPHPETAPAGKGRKVLRGFKVAYVFAQVQTEGEDLPALLTPPMLTGQAPAGLWDGLAAQVAAAGYTLQRGDCGQAEGYTDPKTKTVRVRADLSDSQACSVLTHELAHALLHCAEGYDYAGHRGTAEIEAESVAYLVTCSRGLPSGTCAAPYVAGWAGGDVAKVKAAAERVVRTAHGILDRLDGITDQGAAEATTEHEEQAAA